MTIAEALAIGQKKLASAKIKSSALDAEIILYSVLNKSREYLFAHFSEKMARTRINSYLKLIRERSNRRPVAQLINKKEFWGLDFMVSTRVLIPRPETEILVEEALKIIRLYYPDKKIIIADIGAGSGCLAVALAKSCVCKILAIEKSPAALRVAKQNAINLKAKDKIVFFKGDLLLPIHTKQIDILVANLPYLDKNKKRAHEKNCPELKFEPAGALYAGRKGLDCYYRLLRQMRKLQRQPRFALLEIGAGQAMLLKKTAQKIFPRAKINFIKDHNRRIRVVKIYQFNSPVKSGGTDKSRP